MSEVTMHYGVPGARPGSWILLLKLLLGGCPPSFFNIRLELRYSGNTPHFRLELFAAIVRLESSTPA